MCAGWASVEEPVLASDAEWPNCVFNGVGVGRQERRFEIPYQLGPLAEPIFDGFSQEYMLGNTFKHKEQVAQRGGNRA